MRDSSKHFKVIGLESNDEFILGEPLEDAASFQDQNHDCADINSSTIETADETTNFKFIGPNCKVENDAEFNERKIANTKKESSWDDVIIKKKFDDYDDNEKEKWTSAMPTVQLVPSLTTKEIYSDHLSCLDNYAVNNLAESHHSGVSSGVQLHSTKNKQGENETQIVDPILIEIDDDDTNSCEKIQRHNLPPVNNSLGLQSQGVKSKKASHSTTMPAPFLHTITNAIFKSVDRRLHVASLLTCLPISQHSRAVEFLNQSRRFISLPRGWWTLHPAIIARMSAGKSQIEGNHKGLQVGEQREAIVSVIDPPQQSSLLHKVLKNTSTSNQGESPKTTPPTSLTQLDCTNRTKSLIINENGPATTPISAEKTSCEVVGKTSQVFDNPEPGTNQTKEYKCVHCGKHFDYKHKLNKHVKAVHVETREYSCSICCKAYTVKASLALHIQLVHTNSNDRLQCGKCERSYKNVISLRNHTRTVHSVNGELSSRVSCSICHKFFANKLVMNRHKKKKHNIGTVNELSCNECLKTFCFKYDLIRHLKLTHMEPEILCSYCPLKFPLKERLKTHMRAEHGIENRRTYVCDICGKLIKGKGKQSLEMHLLIHKGLKLYNCSKCGKHFRTDSGLAQHLWTHSDERRFSCHLCDKAFRIKHHLRQHMAVHGLISTPDYRKRRQRTVSTSSSDE